MCINCRHALAYRQIEQHSITTNNDYSVAEDPAGQGERFCQVSGKCATDQLLPFLPPPPPTQDPEADGAPYF